MVEEAKLAAKVEADKVGARPRPRLLSRSSTPGPNCVQRVADLAVAGAERILKREVDAKGHADMLAALKQEL
jgi:F-type H+-transporting ATPase subunit b